MRSAFWTKCATCFKATSAIRIGAVSSTPIKNLPENAPPLRFAIEGFLQEAGVTLIGGLSGHGKTLIMLGMVKALLEGSPLFDHEPFAVPRPALRACCTSPRNLL